MITREAIITGAVVPFPVFTIWALPAFLQLRREGSSSHLPHRVGRWQQGACQRRGYRENLGAISQLPRAEARETPFPGSTAPSDICLGGRARIGLGFVTLSKLWALPCSFQSVNFLWWRYGNNGLQIVFAGFRDTIQGGLGTHGLRVGLTVKSLLSLSFPCSFPVDWMAPCLQEVEVSTTQASPQLFPLPLPAPMWGGEKCGRDWKAF